MSASENSAFIDSSISREVKVYTVTAYNPAFFLIPFLARQGNSAKYQSCQQILEEIISENGEVF
jgi:hypothetical protein